MRFRYISLFLVLLAPICVRPQAFTPRRPFVYSSTPASSTNDTVLFIWFATDTGMSNNITGLSLTNGETVDWWYRKMGGGVVTNAVTRMTPYPNGFYGTNFSNALNGTNAYLNDVRPNPANTGFSFTSDNSAPFSIPQPITIFTAVRVLGWWRSGWPAGGLVSLQSLSNYFGCKTAAGKDYWTLNAGTELVAPEGVETNVWLITTTIFNGANSLFRTNGTHVVSGDAGTNGVNVGYNVEFGSGFGDARYTLDMDLAEIRVYGKLFSTNEFKAMESDLGARYGITITP